MKRSYGLVAIAFGIFYLVSPIDFVPDFIPLAGQLDDLTIAGGSILIGLFILLTGESPKKMVD